MAPFQYTPYHNPYVNTIAELMQRQGDIPAQAAERVAAAQADALRQSAQYQANAQLASGQAWGGAIQNIGQTVAGTIQSLTDPKRKVEALQMQEMQGKLQDQATLRSAQSRLDNAMAAHPLGAGQEGPQAETYLTPDGLNDIPKMQQWLDSAGLAHFAPELLKGAQDINDWTVKSRDHEKQAADSKAIMFGYMANGALKLHQMVGMPLDGAIEFVAQPGVNAKQIRPEELQQFKAGIANLPPDQQVAALQQVKQHGADLAPKKEHGKDTTETNIYGEQTYANTVPTKKPDYTINGQRFDGDTNQPRGPLVAPNPEPAASEQKQGIIKGLPGEHTVSYFPSRDPEKPAKVMFTQADGSMIDVTGRFTPKIPPSIILRDQQNQPINLPNWALNYQTHFGDQGNVFDQDLRMTPNGLAQDALTKIATGNYSGIAGRGGDRFSQVRRAAIDSKAAAIVAASGMDEPALRSYLSANKTSLNKQIAAADQVTGFMAKADLDAGQMEEILKVIPDTGMPILNKPWREFQTSVLGNQNMAELRTRINSVRNEYTRISTGGTNLSQQMTDSSRKDMQQLLNDDATVSQIIRSVRALRDEGDNRLITMDQQIKNTLNRMNIPVKSGTVGGYTYTVREK